MRLPILERTERLGYFKCSGCGGKINFTVDQIRKEEDDCMLCKTLNRPHELVKTELRLRDKIPY